MQNKTLIDIAYQCTKQKEKQREVVNTINHTRIYKRVYLISELLGLKGETPIKCYYYELEKSNYEWNFGFINVMKLKSKVLK